MGAGDDADLGQEVLRIRDIICLRERDKRHPAVNDCLWVEPTVYKAWEHQIVTPSNL